MKNILFSYAFTGIILIAGTHPGFAFSPAENEPGDEHFNVTGNWCDASYTLVAGFGQPQGTWSWTRDGVVIAGANSNSLNLVNLGTGMYIANYVSQDGTIAISETYDFTTSPGPESNFTWVNDGPIAATRFTDSSTAGNAPIVSHTWNFGDGTTSNEQNPVHFYDGWGPRTYTVVLTTTDSNGCSNSVTYLVQWN